MCVSSDGYPVEREKFSFSWPLWPLRGHNDAAGRRRTRASAILSMQRSALPARRLETQHRRALLDASRNFNDEKTSLHLERDGSAPTRT